MEKIFRVKGSDMPRETLDKIEVLWCSRLNPDRGTKSVKPEYFDYYKDDLFFFIREKNIRAAGRLRPVQVNFLGKTYFIQGVSDITSKEKGYGGKLMTDIRNYGIQSEETLVGFCQRELNNFYIKSGFKIIPGAKKRFVYDKPGYVISERDVLYLQGKDGFIDDILSNPEQIIKIPVPHW